MSAPNTNRRVFEPGWSSMPPDLRGSEPRRDEEHVSLSAGPSDDQDQDGPEPFPLDAFPPGPVADMAWAICDSAQVPDSLVGCCVLGAISVSVGSGLQVADSKQNCFSRANLAIVASAESGTGKSVAFKLALAPIQERQAELTDQWKREVFPRLRAEKGIIESEIRRLKTRAFKPMEDAVRSSVIDELAAKEAAFVEVEDQMRGPKLFVEDMTVQALAEIMARAPAETVASISADAGDAVTNLLGRYNPLKRTDDSLYVKGWTGDPHEVDRKSGSFSLRRPCLAVLWLVQRDKLDDILANASLATGGFAARLLACHTNCQPQHIDRGRPEISADTSESYRRLIRQLLDVFRSREAPLTINPTAEGRVALDAYFDGIVDRRLDGELHDITSYAGRWGEQAWRIGLCLHAATWGVEAGDYPLGIETARAAIRMTEWFVRQQLEVLERGRATGRRALQDRVLEALVGKPRGLTARELQRGPLRGMTTAAIQGVLSAMEAAEQIIAHRGEAPASGGHAVRRYRLNVCVGQP